MVKKTLLLLFTCIISMPLTPVKCMCVKNLVMSTQKRGSVARSFSNNLVTQSFMPQLFASRCTFVVDLIDGRFSFHARDPQMTSAYDYQENLRSQLRNKIEQLHERFGIGWASNFSWWKKEYVQELNFFFPAGYKEVVFPYMLPSVNSLEKIKEKNPYGLCSMLNTFFAYVEEQYFLINNYQPVRRMTKEEHHTFEILAQYYSFGSVITWALAPLLIPKSTTIHDVFMMYSDVKEASYFQYLSLQQQAIVHEAML